METNSFPFNAPRAALVAAATQTGSVKPVEPAFELMIKVTR
jgi:hypothetical protein